MLIVESSKQGDRHHQWLRMGLDVRPRLSKIDQDISKLLPFCFNEKARLQDCVRDILHSQHDDSSVIIGGIKSLDHLITTEPRIRDHVGDEVVECLVSHLSSTNHKIKIKAALILPRLKGCPYPSMDKIIHALTDLFLDGHNFERCEVMRTLTSLASDHSSGGLAILESGILEVARTFFDETRLLQEYQIATQCAKFLSALCCRNTKLLLRKKKKGVVLETVATLFKSSEIEIIMPALCCVFYHLSYQQEMAIEKRYIYKFFWLARYHHSWIAIPALMVVGNIVRWGQDQEIKSMIAQDMITTLVQLLDSGFKLVRREACWIISNIAATSGLEEPTRHSAIQRLCQFLLVEASDVKMDAAWAIFNLFTHGFPNYPVPVRRSSGFSTFPTKKRKKPYVV